MDHLELSLPAGAQQTGVLYAGHVQYPSGDVLEISLQGGLTVDLGWEKMGMSSSKEFFYVVVWREYFGDQVERHDGIRGPGIAAKIVEDMAAKYATVP